MLRVMTVGNQNEFDVSWFVQWKNAGISTCGIKLAPPVGFEPTTNRLTAGYSTIELQGNLKFIFP